MKRNSLFLVLVIVFIFSNCEDKALERRVSTFYEIEEDQSLSMEKRHSLLKRYIVPGKGNDSIASFFCKSWEASSEKFRDIDNNILGVEYIENRQKAIVTTEDIIESFDGSETTFISKTIWVYVDGIWYRGHGQSTLYKDGKRIR